VELFDKYAIIIIPKNLVNLLAEYEEIEFIEKPKRISFEVNRERLVSCINPVQSGVYNLFGEGVYAGIIDSRIDYSHPDFRNEDGTTRIVVLWDQTIARNHPAGV
jgi:subtilisin family serine protease